VDAAARQLGAHRSERESVAGSAAAAAAVLVAAVGWPQFIGGKNVKPWAVDAGYTAGTREMSTSVLRSPARSIAPAPGEAGSMTIAVLLAQTVDAATRPCSVTRV
jgi:methylenetetrahydrofolate dehydrogenase (NADP+)/methenyltetrahydrofolate cyclohydrolase